MNKPANNNAKKKVLYVKGLAADKMTRMASMDPYYRNIKFQMPGNNNLETFGNLPGAMNINICFNGEKCRMDIPDVLINCMADVDVLADRLKYLEKVLPEIKKQNPKLKVINDPTAILKTGRSDVSSALQGLKGVKMPKVVKIFAKSRKGLINEIKKNGFKLPIIVKKAGSHNGLDMVLLKSFAEGEVEKLDVFAIDGGGFYITEYVDFKGKDGYYRKGRLIMIGGEVNIKHMVIAKGWNVHARNRADIMEKEPGYYDEEKKFLATGIKNFSKNTLNSIDKINDKVGLDIYGIDFGVMPNKEIVIFELNAAMEFITKKQPDYVNEHQRSILECFQKFTAGLI